MARVSPSKFLGSVGKHESLPSLHFPYTNTPTTKTVSSSHSHAIDIEVPTRNHYSVGDCRVVGSAQAAPHVTGPIAIQTRLLLLSI